MPASPQKRILAADIGGTNCRFARFRADETGTLVLEASARFKTEEQHSFPDLMKRAQRDVGADFDAAVLAVPGPTIRIPVQCINIPWSIDPAEIPFLPRRTWLLNDFAAQGWACLLPEAQDLLPVCGSGLPSPRLSRHQAPCAVIGGGTGLGCCVLAYSPAGEPLVFSSEFGHSLFPLLPEEAEYAAFLRQKGVRQDGDHLLTGRGLTNLHEFYTGQKLSPAHVASVMEHTPVLECFARLYGRACQTLALSSLCLSGLFVSGGVAIANPSIVRHPAFVSSFTDCPKYKGLIESIPVYLIRNSDAALWGAARYALHRFAASKDAQ